MADLINPNPTVFERKDTERSKLPRKAEGEPLDTADIFELIRDIQDPEHPYSLEQLNVVKEGLIHLDHSINTCKCAPSLRRLFTPRLSPPPFTLVDRTLLRSCDRDLLDWTQQDCARGRCVMLRETRLARGTSD